MYLVMGYGSKNLQISIDCDYYWWLVIGMESMMIWDIIMLFDKDDDY